MTDTLIPSPGGPVLCGTVLAGQALCGEVLAPDSYTDFPLDLPDGTAELIVTIPIDVPIVVEVTGMLDLSGDAPTLRIEQYVTVEASGMLDFDGGPAEQFNQRNVIIPEPRFGEFLTCGPEVICGEHLCGELPEGVGDYYYDYQLDLDGYPVTLYIDVDVHAPLTATSAVLELDGSAGVIVNPILMPEVCDDLDLVATLTSELTLVAAPEGELVLVAAACEQR